MSYTQTEISHESQKQNPAQSAIRHGCRDIESLILECEKIEDYRRLEQSLLSVYAALADWTEQQHQKLRRFLRYKTKHANDAGTHLTLL